MKKQFVKLITLAVAVGMAHSANAQESAGTSTFPQPRSVQSESEWKPHIGLKAGFATPEGDQSSAGKFGIDIGYQPSIPVGVGLELSSTDKSLERGYGLLKANYNFGGDMAILKHSYVGLGAGALFKTDGTDFAYAPGLGFDIPVGREMANGGKFSLGASAQYIVSASSDPDMLAVDAVVKYWY